MDAPSTREISRTPLQSAARELAPIALILVGALCGIAWSLALGGRLTTSPPYLFTTGIAMAAALLLAMRGAPRWGYPWMAMGIVGTQALLWAFLISDRDTPASGSVVAIAGLGGPALAAAVGGAIATRSWSDSAFFGGLYLAGANLALPIVLLPPDDGARFGIEASRAIIAVGQAGLTAAAIILWNRDYVMPALGALAAVIVVSSISAGVLVPGSRDDVPADLATFLGAAQGPFRIAILILLVSFAVGGVRRFFSGRGMLAPEQPLSQAVEDTPSVDEIIRDTAESAAGDESEDSPPGNDGPQGADTQQSDRPNEGTASRRADRRRRRRRPR